MRPPLLLDAAADHALVVLGHRGLLATSTQLLGRELRRFLFVLVRRPVRLVRRVGWRLRHDRLLLAASDWGSSRCVALRLPVADVYPPVATRTRALDPAAPRADGRSRGEGLGAPAP
jgi:hypothetical protein